MNNDIIFLQYAVYFLVGFLLGYFVITPIIVKLIGV